MLQQIVGNVDAASAAVLVAIFACLAVVAAVGGKFLARRADIAFQAMKAERTAEREMYDAETGRLVELKNLEPIDDPQEPMP